VTEANTAVVRGRRQPAYRRVTARRVCAAAILVVVATGCARPRPFPAGMRAPIGYEETGPASWYGNPYHGRRAASGEVYDMNQMTAAHRTLPFDTWLVVENLDNGRTAEVRINDRGPFVGNRILDLSYAAARVLGAIGAGVIKVRLLVMAGPVEAPTVALASTPASAPPVRERVFTIQVGAFSTQERASALQRQLPSPDAAVSSIQVAELGGRTIYRVRVGRFTGRAEAEEYARRLSALGYAVIVVDP
jgi:rare lipoprotein A